MRKWMKLAAAVVPMTLAMAIPVFAGQWEQDGVAYRYLKDDGTYAANAWEWIDGNGDGLAECYYFDENGMMAMNQVIDGSIVDKNGAWVVGGYLQQQDLRLSQEEIAAIFQEASDKMNQQGGFDADAKVEMGMSMGEDRLSYVFDMNIKAAGMNTADMKLLYSMDSSVFGLDQHSDMFYQDGYLYMDAEGQKIKMEMPMDTMMAQSQASVSILGDDGLYGMKNLKLFRSGDQVRITYDMDEVTMDQLMAMSGQEAAAQLQQLQEEAGYTVTLKNSSGSAELDANGNITKQYVSMYMEMGLMGYVMGIDMNMDVTVNNPGQPAAFTLPSTEGYMDLIGYADSLAAQGV